ELVPPAERGAVAAAQRDERASLVSQQSLFASQVDQLQIGAGLNNGEAQLLTAATVPASPFEPNPPATAVLALFLGTLLGVGLAFLFEYLDDSLRTKDELERSTAGLPVLGLIPVTPGWRHADDAHTVTLRAPASIAAEAYRSLRASIQFLGLDAPVRTLQITSPSSAEGKTTTVANLCVALAGAGQRVVVVDCDLRRSRLHDFFGLTNEVGFTSVLLGDIPLSEALQPVPGVEGLRVLASGPRPPNPSELLSGSRTIEVIVALQRHADVVVIDSPPVLPVSDALVLAARVDATLLVAHARRTSRRAITRALELLHQVDAPVVGTVLNGTKASEGYGSASGYGYGYGAMTAGRPSGGADAPTGDDEREFVVSR
ncbi:MAG: polysaccharide biosynthesis tyrosine autokinase, partial [Acidimicrobiales bacterium]